MKIKNFSLLNFSKTTDLSFLSSAQIPSFCRESTKINPERTKEKWMLALNLAYIKFSARLVEVELCYVWLSFIIHANKTLSSNVCIGNRMICSDIWRTYHEWYFEIWGSFEISRGIYAKYHVQIMLLFVYTTTGKRFVIFTCRYFK